jgi:DNA processing protein
VTEAEAWLRLGLVPGLGPVALRRLLADFGSPEAAAAASAASLARSVGEKLAAAIRRGPDPVLLEASLRWIDVPGNRLLTLADAEYPGRLLNIPDPPPLLFATGSLRLLERDALAIVGSRNATPQGQVNAEAFARELSHSGFAIVSGLAMGVDAAAHRGGLAGAGGSIAVVGTGLDIIYPARNRELARALAAEGLLLSEFALGTPPVAANFPRRNRVISGLARGVLIVEAALSSGSLITARYALEQGREVFAIPGSIHSPLSKGCHLLIKQGAKLVESARDILEELDAARATALPAETTASREDSALLDALGYDPVDLDTLCARSGLTAESASAMLLALELDGTVARLSGGRFQRIR